jgi:hypothetical protein
MSFRDVIQRRIAVRWSIHCLQQAREVLEQLPEDPTAVEIARDMSNLLTRLQLHLERIYL